MSLLGLRDDTLRSEPKKGNGEWYYATEGSREGPVSAEEMSSLVESGRISGSTLVWKTGMPKWIPLEESDLAVHVTAPPPLPEAAVRNGLVWLIAVYPIIHVMLFGNMLEIVSLTMGLPAFLGDAFVYVVVYSLLAVFDLNRLEKSGHTSGNIASGWIFIIPVYLFKRCRATRSKHYGPFVAWIIAVFVSSTISAISSIQY